MSDTRSMNDRLRDAGVRTIRTGQIGRFGREVIYLEFNGKQVLRPHVGNTEQVCRDALGVEI